MFNMDNEKELARMEGTNFFALMPEGTSRCEWLYAAAKKEAARWGQYDYLANKYARLAAYVRVVDAA